MKKCILISCLLLLFLSSCENFLSEEPKNFLTPSQFYTTPSQVQVAVDGAYADMDLPFMSVALGLPVNEYYSFSSLPGFSLNVFGTASIEEIYETLGQAEIDNQNDYLNHAFNSIYIPMENINSVIANISETEVVDTETRDRYLAQMYFLRAYLYFRGVRLYGEIPLKTTPTQSIANVEIPKAPVEAIYDQIEADLEAAETMGLPWVDVSGHADLGAVKALLAEVYLTRAGYPLQQTEYYERAYNKALEVKDSGEYRLFNNYEDLRDPANFNQGEHIFMIQRKANVAENPLHFAMLPAPGKTESPISENQIFNPALLPTMTFYNSYEASDRRTEDFAYFYEYTPGEVMNYKYWDEQAAESGDGGANIPRIRYADVLLTLAEAKAAADDGATSDAEAIDAYHQVRERAFPGIVRPTEISVEDVLKERFWEQSFEYKIWFTMIRMRRTFDDANGEIVPMIGHTANTDKRLRAFTESDLLLPLPLEAIQDNPMLLEDAVDPREQEEE